MEQIVESEDGYAEGDDYAGHMDEFEDLEDESDEADTIEEEHAEEIEDEQEEAPVEEEPLSSDQLKNLHAKIDQDTDGKVSMSELLAFSSLTRKSIAVLDTDSLTHELDRNKDGKVSLDELLNVSLSETAPEDEVEESVAKAEDIQSARELLKAKFSAADENGDGHLDKGELTSVLHPETHAKVLHHQAAHTLKLRDRDGDGGLSEQEFWDIDGSEDEETLEQQSSEFKMLDVDHNGKLSLEELEPWESGMFHTGEALKALFDIADVDRDTFLSAEELDQARHALGGSLTESHLVEWAEHHEL